MKLIKNEAQAGVLSSTIFNRLPEIIRDNFDIYKESPPFKMALLVSDSAPNPLKNAILKSIDSLNLGDWIPANHNIKYGKHARLFQGQLKIILKNKPY